MALTATILSSGITPTIAAKSVISGGPLFTTYTTTQTSGFLHIGLDCIGKFNDPKGYPKGGVALTLRDKDNVKAAEFHVQQKDFKASYVPVSWGPSGNDSVAFYQARLILGLNVTEGEVSDSITTNGHEMRYNISEVGFSTFSVEVDCGGFNAGNLLEVRCVLQGDPAMPNGGFLSSTTPPNSAGEQTLTIAGAITNPA